ncbi:Hypothetical protein ORPV_1074 [Orpheovirus IHUMI-LCC2]|uniref:F-box domain-containing protein n=1 Tax=Orpheovirus IHUMI-LCC2 TaxID=2023057 RepID=A0A2I2L5Z7_9VIRU|nr:Hypothetical protein ORPV_1074 [Orpheovirus IHUMI-LCC2]SNW62978.1 Hypothetical protein ORPV_1074 [Orpheovirus IHUMI-LCC2]
MELFTLPNEILFYIFEYVNNIKDINSFICSYKDGYKIRNYISIISNNINNYTILYKYPNLRICTENIFIYKENIVYFNLHKVCLSLEFTLDAVYPFINSYIMEHLAKGNKKSYIKFNFSNYYDFCDDYILSKYSEYYKFIIDGNILKLDLFCGKEEENYIYNTVRLLISNNVINNIEFEDHGDNLLPFILKQKVNKIYIETNPSNFKNHMKSNDFMDAMVMAISNVQDLTFFNLFDDINSIKLFKKFINEVFNKIKNQNIMDYEMKCINIIITHKDKDVLIKLYHNSEFLMS